MITPDYVRRMAAYNAWQNRQLDQAMAVLDHDALIVDRQGFWGSILGTANHILWGDAIWMTRFDGGPGPGAAQAESATLYPTHATWSAERFRMDGRIRLWADGLRAVDLAGPHRWHSPMLGRDVEKPMSVVVMHMFNHQTHHRGQIHAMLTAAGAEAPVSDLFLMPEPA
jgi:uncharacterized damage-inducible protein DinB